MKMKKHYNNMSEALVMQWTFLNEFLEDAQQQNEQSTCDALIVLWMCIQAAIVR